MPYSFLLRLLPTETPPHLYRATVHNADGTHEAFLLLTSDPPSVHLTDARETPRAAYGCPWRTAPWKGPTPSRRRRTPPSPRRTS